VVGADLFDAPPSTKNKDGKRDPEMHQSQKGNDWHFGMKAMLVSMPLPAWYTLSSRQLATSPTSRRRTRCCMVTRLPGQQLFQRIGERCFDLLRQLLAHQILDKDDRACHRTRLRRGRTGQQGHSKHTRASNLHGYLAMMITGRPPGGMRRQ
jgi:hypothetical protein